MRTIALLWNFSVLFNDHIAFNVKRERSITRNAISVQKEVIRGNGDPQPPELESMRLQEDYLQEFLTSLELYEFRGPSMTERKRECHLPRQFCSAARTNLEHASSDLRLFLGSIRMGADF
jgi:hypothetical protein